MVAATATAASAVLTMLVKDFNYVNLTYSLNKDENSQILSCSLKTQDFEFIVLHINGSHCDVSM